VIFVYHQSNIVSRSNSKYENINCSVAFRDPIQELSKFPVTVASKIHIKDFLGDTKASK